MTGGEALVKTLYREGVRVVFGLPGVQLYGAMAALRAEPGIRFITTRHEQATAYMADGFARAGGEGGFGTSLVVPGPGLLNASAAMSTAYSASSPVLVVSGQIPRDKIGQNVGVLHEVNDQLDAIAPITKWRRRVLQVSEIPSAAHEAVFQLKTGRPRPVEIEIPPETLEEYEEADLVEPANPARPAAEANAIDRAVDMLARAEKPVIYAGGGIGLAHAEEPLRRLAEHLQAAVIHSHEGKGAVTDDNYLSLGAALYRGSRATEYAQSADVVLAVGSRLAMAPFTQDQQIIQLDIDGDEIGRNYANTFGLEGDAAATLRSLAEGVTAASAPR
ncbi:MAG: thiamine pyrophosphate-binding protein, partial [Chloroflexota bacterium]